MRRSGVIVAVICAVFFLALFLSATYPVVPSNSWIAANPLSTPRSGATATLMPDGRVLVAGGFDSSGNPLASVEVYDSTGGVSALPSMNSPRANHAAIMLLDGEVLVTGGTTSGGGTTNSAELYDPAANIWTNVPLAMLQARSGHTISQLQNGDVLIAGGTNSSGPISVLEIFDETSNTFTAAGTLQTARANHATTILNDGRAVIIGGTTVASDGSTQTLASTEIFDPTTHAVSAGPNLITARSGHSATTVLDGRVVVIGGTNPALATNGSSGELATAEIFDPSASSPAFTQSASQLASARTGHMALLLFNNNNVLVVGGTAAGAQLSSVELYNPWTDAFQAVGSMNAARAFAAGSNLNGPTVTGSDGRLLVAGGQNSSGTLASADLFGFATVKTDQADYAPNTTVNITGSGFNPGENVTITLVESPLIDTHGPFTVVADINGNFSDSSFTTDLHDLNVKFYLTAVGSQSGFVAQNTFTDSKPNTVTVGPQQTNPIAPGGSTQYLVTVNFNGNGSPCTSPLTVSSTLPAGVTSSFSPSSLTSTGGNATSTLTISTTNATPPGVTNFTVLAGNGGGTCQAGTATNTASLVVLESTASTLTSSQNPTVFGQSTTLKATVTQTAGPTTPTGGTVTFLDGAITIGTATLSNGTATLATSALTSGSHHLTASYAGVANTFGASTSPAIIQTVSQASTTTTVASSANPSGFGQAVTFTATVTPVSPGAGNPTGTVSFTDGTTTLGTASLSTTGGVTTATFSTSTLAVGGHSITASYAGDTNFTGSSTAAALTQTVNQATATTTVGSTANPSVFGQSVTFTATVSTTGNGTPTGTVTFNDGSTTLGTGSLSTTGGVTTTTLTTATLAVGLHSITAAYGGDSNFSGSTSHVLSQTVNKDGTIAALTSSANPAVFGQAITFTITVSAASPGAGTPTGTVTLNNGTNQVGNPASLSGGQATIIVSNLSVGTTGIKASYSGDSNFNSSQTQSALSQVVNQGGTTTTVSSSANPATLGQPVMFTATVAVTAPAAGTPTGTVTFKDGATTLGTGAVTAGQATFNTSSLTAGSHSITASYGGDTSFSGSASATLTQAVNYPAPTLTAISPTTGNLTSTFNVTLTGTGFISGVTTVSFGADITVNNVTVNSSTSVTANITIPTTATVGAHNVSATNPAPGGGTATLNGAFTVNNPATTTGVSSSLPTSTFGQAVTFTATVTSQAGTPQGTVTFFDGATNCLTGTSLGSAALVSGAGSVNVSTLNAGSHTITACYVPSDYHLASNGSVTQQVNQASATISVTPYNLTYDALPHTATATATGVGGVDLSADLNLTGTTHTSAGDYANDPWMFHDPTGNYSDASSTVHDVINKAPVMITINDPKPTYDGQQHQASISVVPTVSVLVTYDGAPSGSNAPVAAGVHSVSVTVTDANYTGSAIGTLTIQQAVLTVTANDKTRAYGTANPTFDGTITGIVNNDPITATYSTTASENSSVGTYPITPTLSDGGTGRLANYSVTSKNGTLTITADPLYVISPDNSRAFGAADSPLTPVLQGLTNGDTANSVGGPMCNAVASSTSKPGTYAIVCSGVTSANYTATYINGTLTITNPLNSITAVQDKNGNTSETLQIGQSDVLTAYGQFADGNTRALASEGGLAFNRAGLTTPVSGAAVAEAGGALYVIGGFDGQHTLGTIQIYDPTTNTWASPTTPSLTTPRTNAAVVSAEGKIYVVGGRDSGNNLLSSIEVLDTTGGTPTISPFGVGSLSSARSNAAAAVWGNKLYVIGGSNGSAQSTVDTFDLVLGTVSTGNAGTAFDQASAAVLNKTLYVIGTSAGSVVAAKFDGTNWSSVSTSAASLEATKGAGVTAFDNLIYVVNGTSVWSFDGANFAQETNPLGNEHDSAQPVVIGSTLYVASAGAGAQNSQLDAFAPPEVSWSPTGANQADASIDAAGNVTALARTDNATPSYVAVTAMSIANSSITSEFQLTINRKSQTITFGALSDKTYGDPDFLISAASVDSGSNSTNLLVSFATGAGDSCTVGASTLSGGTSSGTVHITGAGSCTITASQAGDTTTWAPATDVMQKIQIAQAPLTVTAQDASPMYTGLPFSSPTVNYAGLVNGESSAVLGGTLTFTYVGTISTVYPGPGAPTDAGTYSVTPGGLTSANYTIVFVAGTLTINKAHLTVSADNQLKTYDGSVFSPFTATLSGLVNSETDAGLRTSGALSGSAGFTGSATTEKNAGIYTITPNVGTLMATNYDFTIFVNGTLTINKAHLTVTADNKSRVYGAPNPPLTYTLSGFKNAEDATIAHVTGSATLVTAATTSSPVAGYPITVGDAGTLSAANYDFPSANFVNGTLTVTPASTSTGVSSSPNASVFGQPVTFTATVTPVAPSTITPPDGTVTFYDGTSPVGTGTVNSGIATFTTPTATALTAGSHSITAVYGGDRVGNFAVSPPSPALIQVVNKATTSTTIISGLNSSIYGQVVTFTATVSPQYAGTPTGTVTFSDGQNQIGMQSLSGGIATLTTSPTGLTAGTHAITATYSSGDGNFLASAASAPLSQTVKQAATTTSVSSSLNPSIYGQAVMFTATVSPQYAGTPTGMVTFYDGASQIGTGNLNGGTAMLTTQATGLTAGAHNITVAYAGDSNFTTSSTASALAQAVNKASVTISVTSTPSPSSIYNQSVTFTAAAMPQYAGVPTGTITFTDGACGSGTALASPVTLNSSDQAGFATSTLIPGAHTISACYSGDSNFTTGSGSKAFSVTFATGGTCTNGVASHIILQPINADGSSVFKMGSTVPTKFVVCDVNGKSVGPNAAFPNSSVVASYHLVNAVGGVVSNVDETVYSTTPDQYFRWDSTAQQWIFNQSTGKNTNLNVAPATYYFQIMLIDGTVIGTGTAVPGAGYQYGLR